MLIIEEDNNSMSFNSVIVDRKERQKIVELMAKFYSIPKENILADRTSLKHLLMHEDSDGIWMDQYYAEQNEAR